MEREIKNIDAWLSILEKDLMSRPETFNSDIYSLRDKQLCVSYNLYCGFLFYHIESPVVIRFTLRQKLKFHKLLKTWQIAKLFYSKETFGKKSV